MDQSNELAKIVEGLKSGGVVPYLGPGALKGVNSLEHNQPIPADSDSLILAMNKGKPMAPRLMYEFARAAMSMELKRGRRFVESFLTDIYHHQAWQQSVLHAWLAKLAIPYIIDINRDTQLQQNYLGRQHYLILGTARITGTHFRYKIYVSDGSKYIPIANEDATQNLPTLFKPMGSPLPEPSFIASDADYVDYITELMGGFAIPGYIKEYRKQKQYLFLGMRLTRDTERMVLSDLIFGANEPAGWALIPTPTEKEKRFCANKNIQIIETDWETLISEHTNSPQTKEQKSSSTACA